MRPGRFRLGSVDVLRRRLNRSALCFNEARAFPPGKWIRFMVQNAMSAFASMRPGRFRLGSGARYFAQMLQKYGLQ